VPPRIIDVTAQNIDKYPPTCFLNPKNEGYLKKVEWLKERFEEGLRIKVLYDEADGKIHGFIEYTPGEYAWRAVNAEGYLFIHCIWVTPNSYREKGYASDLIRECMNDAAGKLGVAVVASDGPFMAARDLFLKNGFTVVEEDGKKPSAGETIERWWVAAEVSGLQRTIEQLPGVADCLLQPVSVCRTVHP